MAYLRILSLLVVATTLGTLAFSSPVAADTNLPIGGQGQVTNTDGEGVRLRTAPTVSADTLRTLAEGWRVTVLGGPISGDNGSAWYKVEHTGATGFVVADYLTTATGATGSLASGETAQVATDDGTSLRLRAEPNGTVLATMPNGAQVPVVAGPSTDGSGQRWYQVTYEGQTGWALGAYLRPSGQMVAQRDTTSRAGSRTPDAPSSPPPAPAQPSTARRGSGAAMVALAKELIGSPYVWGGTSPAGFDCSGLTRYVALKTLGVEIGRDVFAQINAGVPVAPDDLQPGDLVFQKNTYRWGLSHVGIYIGGGQMVSAQSESTGVRIQNIWDGYWGPRFYGARRLT